MSLPWLPWICHFVCFFIRSLMFFSCHNLLFVWGKSFGRCSKHVERFMSFLVGFDCCFHLWSYPFNLHSLCKHGTIEFQKKIQGCGTPQEFLSQLPNPPKKKRKNKRRAVTLTCCRLVVSFPSGYHGLHSLCIEFYAGKSGQTCNHDRYTGPGWRGWDGVQFQVLLGHYGVTPFSSF